MADLENDFEKGDLSNMSDAARSGAPVKTQPSTSQQHSDFENADLSAVSDANQTKVQPAPQERKVLEEEKPYEKKIQSYSEYAKNKVKEEGPEGAFLHGLANVPFITPAIEEGYRHYQAYTGRGKGDTHEERMEDLRAQREAYNREVKAQHPYMEIAGQVAQTVPLMFIPGVGMVPALARAGATEAVTAARAGGAGSKLLNYVPAAAEIGGFGAEGAGWGAASAAGEKYFGTAQPSEKQDIGEAAKEGAMFGAGIGTLGKGVGAVYDKMAPDWWKNARLTPDMVRGWLGKDDPIVEQFIKNQYKDDPTGKWAKDLESALKSGADVNAFDYRGPTNDAMLQSLAKDHPDSLEQLRQMLNNRLAEAPDRGKAFFKKLAGMEPDESFNPDAIKKLAQSVKEQTNAANFQEAYHPDNARGFWKDDWLGAMNDPAVDRAVSQFDQEFRRLKGKEWESPFGARGETSIDTLDNAKLSPENKEILKSYGVETLDDLNNLRPKDVESIFGFDPTIPSDTKNSFNTKKILDSLQEPLKGVDLSERVLLRPDNINAEYLDNLQLRLKQLASKTDEDSLPIYQKASAKLNDFADTIASNLRSENPIYEKAASARDMFHRQEDSYEAGLQFLKKINDPMYRSKANNEIAQMTDQEKNLFMHGVLADMEAQGITGGGTSKGAPQNIQVAYKKLQNWFAQDNVKEGLTMAMGKEGFENMQSFLMGQMLAKDSAQRAESLGGRSNFVNSLIRRTYIPGAGSLLEQFALGHTGYGMAAIAYRVADFIMGERYAKKVFDKLSSGNPQEFLDVYKTIMEDPRLREGISNYTAAFAYAMAANQGKSKYDAEKVNKYISQKSDDTQKFLTEDAMRTAANLGHTVSGNVKANVEKIPSYFGFNTGGRVGYNKGGRTPFNWRQFYAPKGDTVGPVAPKRLATDEDGNRVIMGYHGSPRRFSKFSDDFLLTGSGRSSFGPPAHYIAQNRNIAQKYMDKREPGSGEGYLYRVRAKANPDHFIDWNAEWGRQHPELVANVNAAIKDLGVKGLSPSAMKREYMTGEDLYNRLTSHRIHPNVIKEALMNQGVKGMKFFDEYAKSRTSGYNPNNPYDLNALKQGKSARNFAVFDPNDLQIMEHMANGGKVDLWHEDHRIHRKLGGQLSASVNPAESARQQRMIESGLTNPVYHGTMANFNKFDPSPRPYLPLLLGTHVAKDPNISNTFADLNTRLPSDQIKNGDWEGKIPNVMPLMTHDESKFLTVEQPERFGHIRHDDRSVVAEVMHHLMRKHPELAHEMIQKSRGLSPEDAKKTYEKLLANKYYHLDRLNKDEINIWYPHNHLKSFIADVALDAPFGHERKFADLYRKDMLAKGYKGLKYINTATHETKHAKDPTSYIVFHPEEDNTDWHPLRSKFAKFDPAKKSSKDIRESRGGYIKRATGGRIPEADKMFKDAKKYIDSHTKGLLNEPDEKIVHALRIAKARNG